MGDGGQGACSIHIHPAHRATVQNCVLSHHVEVGEGVTLRDCYVGPRFVIPQGSGSHEYT